MARLIIFTKIIKNNLLLKLKTGRWSGKCGVTAALCCCDCESQVKLSFHYKGNEEMTPFLANKMPRRSRKSSTHTTQFYDWIAHYEDRSVRSVSSFRNKRSQSSLEWLVEDMSRLSLRRSSFELQIKVRSLLLT